MFQTLPSQLATFRFAAALAGQRKALHSRRLMLKLSYLIEDHAANAPETTLIAAFQRLSLVGPQLQRYQALAPRLAHTYILGMPDAELPALPNTTVIPLHATWPLIHEWVVIATGPACCVGLFADDPAELQPAQRAKQFHGLWSTTPAIVDRAYASFLAALGKPAPRITRNTRATLETTRQLQHAIQARA